MFNYNYLKLININFMKTNDYFFSNLNITYDEFNKFRNLGCTALCVTYDYTQRKLLI